MSLPRTTLYVHQPLSAARGFTLLEVLVVLFIIGIIVSFASLSIDQNSDRLVDDEARRLHRLLQLASGEAVLQGNEFALALTAGGYSFLRLDGEQWLPLSEDRQLRERSLTESVVMSLVLEGVAIDLQDKQTPPRILLLSSGEITPFELRFSGPDATAMLLRGEADGKLSLVKVDDV